MAKTDFAKQLFLLDIEQGSEVYIPKSFNQSDLPISFRYYDPIMKIVEDEMSDEKKMYFKLKTEFKLMQMIKNILFLRRDFQEIKDFSLQ